MNLLINDLEDFVARHRPHGELVATEGGLTTQRLPPRGVLPLWGHVERWVTPEDAAVDLALMARWN